jgi:HD-GYP domain-containing protein (c-di-GMP phosphodiesterase class II)
LTGTPEAKGESWAERPRLGAALAVAIAGVPVLGALGAAFVLHQVVPIPEETPGIVIRVVAILLAALLVLIVVERGTRRLAPLAALLRMSLLFPDQAPSRFSTALRSGNSKQLADRVEEIKRTGLSSDPNEAAREVLELVSALSKHDPRTRGHSERVRAYAEMLGAELHLSDADRHRLRWASLLHDIGKLTVPHEILNKPGKPTDEEWQRLQAHPVEGGRLVAPLADWLGDWSLTTEQHHEKWDGSGYPKKLAGHDIALGARIVSLVDAFEVMTAARSYKKAASPTSARQELLRCAGTHFDPDIVRAFLNISVGRLRWATGPAALVGTGLILSDFRFLSLFGGDDGDASFAIDDHDLDDDDDGDVDLDGDDDDDDDFDMDHHGHF